MSTITWIDDIAAKLSQGVMYAAIPMIGQNFAAGNILRRGRSYGIPWRCLPCPAQLFDRGNAAA